MRLWPKRKKANSPAKRTADSLRALRRQQASITHRKTNSSNDAPDRSSDGTASGFGAP